MKELRQPERLLTWNIANGELLLTIPLPVTARRLEYSADNLKLVVTGEDKTVRVLGVADGALQQEIPSAENVRVARFAPDSRNLLLGGDGENTAQLALRVADRREDSDRTRRRRLLGEVHTRRKTPRLVQR